MLTDQIENVPGKINQAFRESLNNQGVDRRIIDELVVILSATNPPKADEILDFYRDVVKGGAR